MQTCRAILKNNQISFIDEAPFPLDDERDHYILITFLGDKLELTPDDSRETIIIHKIANLHIELSNTELKMLQLVKQGLTNKQIGEKLEISPGTVRNYLANAYHKLKVNNRIGAIVKAVELGLLK